MANTYLNVPESIHRRYPCFPLLNDPEYCPSAGASLCGGRMHSYNYWLGYSGCFPWKPRKQNPRCYSKCIISSSCSLTPLIFLTHLARGVPFLRPPRASLQLEMLKTARSTSCGRGYWITCFKGSDSRCFFKKIREWTEWLVQIIRVSSLFLFKKWLCTGGLPRNTIIGQPGVRFMSSQITSLAIFRKGKAEYARGTMTAVVSSWGRACGSFPAFGGKRTHNVHFLNTGCAARLAGHFPPCHILLDEGSRGQDRKRQILRIRQGFPRAVIGSLEL